MLRVGQADCTQPAMHLMVMAGTTPLPLSGGQSGITFPPRLPFRATLARVLPRRRSNGTATMKPIALLPLIAIAACQQPRPAVVLPPLELTTCAEAPTPPSLPAKDGTEATQLVRDRLILEYILAWNTAHGDCAGKVAGLARWRESVGD